jgi:tetratricopeptide (TPR) repeat protein
MDELSAANESRMRWNHDEPYSPPPQTLAALARQALERTPGSPALETRLGRALVALKQYGEAVEYLARSAAAAPEAFTAWNLLAICRIENGEAEEALAVCDRAAAFGHEQGLNYLRARALLKLKRETEGLALLRRAAHKGANGFALRRLLRRLIRRGDARAVLAECEALPDLIGYSPTAVAFRGIALSMLSRNAEACTLVDLNRHVLRLPFTAHEAFGGLEAFHRGLAEDLRDDWQGVPGARDGFEFYDLRFDRGPRLAALRCSCSRRPNAVLRSAAYGAPIARSDCHLMRRDSWAERRCCDAAGATVSTYMRVALSPWSTI